MSPPGVMDLLETAERSLAAAEGLLADGFPDFAVARSYYAMFYATQAVLLSRDQSFSKHSAVIAAFGREFVKSGLLPPSLHRDLLEDMNYATLETTALPTLSIIRLLPKPSRKPRSSVRLSATS